MTIYTHWTESPTGELKREFFGRKSQEEAAAKKARATGMNVLGVASYSVEPTAEAVAAFVNERQATTSYDQAEEFLAVAHVDLGGILS